MRHIHTYDDPPNPRHLDEACRALGDGGIVAYPTDVNWALGCDASDGRALDRLRLLKPHHSRDKPFSLICADFSMAAQVAIIEHATFRALKRLLPGPYTILLRSARTLPRQIGDKRKVVGVRIPKSPLLLTLVARYGKPLATTSVLGEPTADDDGLGHPPLFGSEVAALYRHGIDVLLDLDEGVPGTETTILDFTSGAMEIVRIGAGEVDGIA